VISRALALVLAGALALAACGGDGETKTVTAGADDGPSLEEDTAAIEQLMVEWGASVGKESCDFYSADFLAEFGGLGGCRNDAADIEAATFRVEDVTVDGDTGSATVVRADPRGRPAPITYPLRRDGEPSDIYNGWKLDGSFTRGTSIEESSEPPPADDDQTAGESSPQTPEQKAAAYRDCIEGRGAEDVKQDQFPSVDFSGGGSRVIASFGSSEKDAEEGFATISQRNPFFVKRFGTVVLYAVGDPLADDLETGLSCVKEIG
jgi:hypothetical protein